MGQEWAVLTFLKFTESLITCYFTTSQLFAANKRTMLTRRVQPHIPQVRDPAGFTQFSAAIWTWSTRLGFTIVSKHLYNSLFRETEERNTQ